MNNTTIGEKNWKELLADWFYSADADELLQMSIADYAAYSAIAEDVLAEQAEMANDHHFYLEDYMHQFSI